MGKKEDVEKQYDLGLKEPWSNKFWKQRYKVTKRFHKLEGYRFMKQSAVWLLIAMAILANALIYDYFKDIESTLPSVVPFLNNYIQLAPRLINLDELAYLPIVTATTTVFLVALSIKLFNRKPYYSLLVLMILFVALSGVLLNLVNLSNQYL